MESMLKRKISEVDVSDNSCTLPYDNWLDQAVRRMSATSKTLQSWDLKYQTFISLIACDNGARIHIREFAENHMGQQFPTKNGVVMTTETFFFLTEKIFNFNLTPADSSFVCNNQLLVLNCNERCVMQQMFKDGDFQFMVKPKGIKLLPEQVGYLREHICEISEVIMEYQFEVFLPKLILREIHSKCMFHTHEVEESVAQKNLFQVLYTELSAVTNRLLACEGCNIDDPSQFNHLCMTLSMADKLFRASSNCYILINFFDAVKNLRTRFCVCQYNNDFFKDKKMDFYREGLSKMAETGCDVLL